MQACEGIKSHAHPAAACPANKPAFCLQCEGRLNTSNSGSGGGNDPAVACVATVQLCTRVPSAIQLRILHIKTAHLRLCSLAAVRLLLPL